MSDVPELGEFLSEWMRTGWTRVLPWSALDVVGTAVTFAIEERFAGLGEARNIRRLGGLTGPAWGTPTEEDLDDAAEVALRAEHRADVAMIADQVGLQAPETVGDVADLVVALGLVTRDGTNEGAWWAVRWPLPLPDDLVRLSPARQAAEDKIRWQAQHEATAQDVIRLFVDGDLDYVERTLESLGEEIETDPENVRHGIANLLDEGDFSASVDVERIRPNEAFELRVDWRLFRENRITISHDAAEDTD